MVTIIKFGRTLRSPFHYNENKLKEGKAELIHTANYGKDIELLSRRDRIARLEKLADRNEKAQLKSAHITINFSPDEKLDKEILQQIADRYMREIGFGDQPYLVYQHYDAAHPHVHILSMLTRLDGTRIPTHYIGKEKSEPARQLIEREFGLIAAQKTDLRQAWKTLPIDAEKIQYGRTETLRGIAVILDSILPRYHYTSLSELNAILRKYNVMADNGGEGSRIRQRGGLVYRVLDDKGNKVGVPIKASVIYSRPTLKFLEKQFTHNTTLRAEGKPLLKQAIDLALELDRPRNLEELQNALGRQGVDLILRANEKGAVYGMTYIDHRLKNVFNGSDLGKTYSVSGMIDRLKNPAPRPTHHQHPKTPLPETRTLDPREIEKAAITAPALKFDPLPASQRQIQEEPVEPDPNTLKKRKKKRKRLHL